MWTNPSRLSLIVATARKANPGMSDWQIIRDAIVGTFALMAGFAVPALLIWSFS